MAQTKIGAAKIRAKALGMSVEEYLQRREAGEKWCWKCRAWRAIDEFSRDRSRGDGVDAKCGGCRRVKERKSTKGRPSSFKGRHHTEESKRRLSESSRRHPPNRLGKPCTEEQKDRMSALAIARGRRGPLAHTWRGGITPEHKRIRQTPEMKAWRRKVLRRDGRRCRLLNGPCGGRVTAHHVKPFADFPELRTDVDNGITACEACHKRVHGRSTNG